MTYLAIFFGAGMGALLRFGLGTWFNASLPSLPLGTLIANWLGGYLIGIAVAFFALHPTLSPLWKLMIVTGFLGGLTTFSTFSAEIVGALRVGMWEIALVGAMLHVIGSLAWTFAGIATYKGISG